MVEVYCDIRYRSQLRRLRREPLDTLENAIKTAFLEAGGKIFEKDNAITALFDESVLAFWLELIVVLDRVAQALDAAKPELFGYACLARVIELETPLAKHEIRGLSAVSHPLGVWCDRNVERAVSEYAVFGAAGNYKPLIAFRYRAQTDDNNYWERTAVQDELVGLLEATSPGTVFGLFGPRWTGKRQALRTWAIGASKTTPILRFNFREGLPGIAAFADAMDESVEAFVLPCFDQNARDTGQRLTKAIRSFRLSTVLPIALIEAFINYLREFAEAFARKAKKAAIRPAMLLENLQWADALGASIVERVLWPLASEGTWRVVVSALNPELPLLRKFSLLRVARLELPSAQELSRLVRLFGTEATALTDVSGLGAELRLAGLPGVYRRLIGWKRGRDGMLYPPSRLTDDYMELAYALYLSRPLFPWPVFKTLLIKNGKTALACENAIKSLCIIGLLDSESDLENVVPDFVAFAEQRLGAKANKARRVVHDYAVQALRSGLLESSVELLRLLAVLAKDIDQVLPLAESDWYEAIDNDLPEEDPNEPVWLSESYLSSAMGEKEATELTILANGSHALRRASVESRRAWFARPIPESFSSSVRRSNVLLDYASESYALGDINEAAALAKDALIKLQSRDSNRGLARAYRLLGACELAKEKITESLDYYQFAMETAGRFSDKRETVIASASAAVGEFLLGNIAKAERLAQRAENLASARYIKNWGRWTRFLQARLRFEAGHYQEAADIFKALLENSGITEDQIQTETLKAWETRASCFAGDRKPPESVQAVLNDAGLFAVERLYFSGAYNEALNAADRMLTNAVERPFLGPERVDWSSGFAMVEDRVIGILGGERSDRRLLKTYRALARAAMGEGAIALEELRKLTKDEKISILDPNEAFYFASYASILSKLAASSVDQGTILGIAFKRLQRRASRIDEPRTKRCYMTMNINNAALLAEAKRHNLI